VPSFAKDPQANLDYSIDWDHNVAGAASGTGYLGASETISSSSWSVSPSGLTVGSTANDGKKTTVWLSSGSAGTNYSVTNTITTSQGRTDERSFDVECINR
jgi:hypothetical protein